MMENKKSIQKQTSEATDEFQEFVMHMHEKNKWIHYGFKDVIGQEKAIEFLKADIENPDANHKYLLYGPPGVGKTFLAHAFASWLVEEKGYHCLKINDSDIFSHFVGESEKRLFAVFREAASSAPCVVFFVDLDSICPDRNGEGVRRYQISLLEAFLEGLETIKVAPADVILLGTSSCPFSLDAAVCGQMTPVFVSTPNVEVRKAFLQSRFESVKLESGITFEEMAEATEGFNYYNLRRMADNILCEIRDDLFKACAVIKDGQVDNEKTDLAMVEAIENEKAIMTRDRFLQECERNLPTKEYLGYLHRLEDFRKHCNK